MDGGGVVKAFQHSAIATEIGVYNQSHEPTPFPFVGKVQAGFTPRIRAALLEKLKDRLVRGCPFVNLPHRTRGRWRGGITAEDMADYRWLRESVPAQVGFTEWTEGGLLRHSVLVA